MSVQDTGDEKKLNRGYVTVYEHVRDSENHDEGDRYCHLGYDTERYHLVNEGEEDQGFVVAAVPIAHIELPELLDGDDGLSEWLNSDVGKLAMKPFFDEIEMADVLTTRGKEMMDDV